VNVLRVTVDHGNPFTHSNTLLYFSSHHGWLGIIHNNKPNGHRRGNDFSVGGAKIERPFSWGSKNWWKTIKTIKFKA